MDEGENIIKLKPNKMKKNARDRESLVFVAKP